MSFNENSISVVSLNTDGHNNIDNILPFLKERNPEVVLFQDCFERTSSMVADGLGLEPAFVAQRRKNLYFPNRGDVELCGIATLSKYGFNSRKTFNYIEDGEDNIPMHQKWSPGEEVERLRRTVLVTEVPKGHERFRFGNTYFTWTPDGKPSDFQRIDMEKMLSFLSIYDELILCGDFNAPRGGEIFEKLSARYIDNIPLEVQSTLDSDLHPASKKGVNVVVDGLFTTPGYKALDIEIVSGVSDHCAVVATIKKLNF